MSIRDLGDAPFFGTVPRGVGRCTVPAQEAGAYRLHETDATEAAMRCRDFDVFPCKHCGLLYARPKAKPCGLKMAFSHRTERATYWQVVCDQESGHALDHGGQGPDGKRVIWSRESSP